MEKIFENKHTRDEEFYAEYYRYFSFKRPKTIFICGFLFVVFLIGLLALFRIIEVGSMLTLVYIVLPLVGWATILFRYFNLKKMSYARDLELGNGAPIEVRSVLTEEGIGVYKGDAETPHHVDLSNIGKVAETKNYYLLLSVARQSFVFRKDGFLKGTTEEFLEFLEEKGIRK